LYFKHLSPDEAWMQQIARDATDESGGIWISGAYALHDRDTKFCALFRATLQSGGIQPIQLPARSPNLNAFAERWVRSVKQACLSKLILFGEVSLRRAFAEFIGRSLCFRMFRNFIPYSTSRLCNAIRLRRPAWCRGWGPLDL
jgi:hypothetical protein